MEKPQKELSLDPAQLFFIPLGGSEEFGVNFNLYAHAGKFLAVDCGLGFADHRFPGVDILLPDATFIADRQKNLAGLVITHAHEDHIGAVSYLWPRLKCPIYCTAFTAAVLKRKLSESPDCRSARITVVNTGSEVEIGPFKVHFIHVAHSIPDTAALMIETKVGRVLHSGDWNLDPKPVLNPPTDDKSFRQFGDKGIVAYIGDSTNAEVPGRAGSETEVEAGMTALFAECKGRIAVTIFASNISRIRSVARAARANRRHVALIGRSLHTMSGAAFDCGYLDDIPAFINEDEIDSFPANQIVMLVTGSQGEVRAALARIARGENRDVVFGRGDTIIFSSRAIPGNEMEINEVKNNLVAGGSTVITPYDTSHKIHVSGHPCRDEIAEMYQWVRPKLVVPVHGQRTQLEAQAAFARSCQIENVIVPSNGSVIRLAPGAPAVIDHIPTGLLAVEPNRIISADHLAIAERRKLQFTGAIHVTVVLDGQGRIVSAPQVSSTGLIDPQKPEEMRMIRSIVGEIEDILADMHNKDLMDDHAVHEEIRIGVRRLAVMLLGIKPKTTVHVVRV
jgi:ribonuclease J